MQTDEKTKETLLVFWEELDQVDIESILSPHGHDRLITLFTESVPIGIDINQLSETLIEAIQRAEITI